MRQLVLILLFLVSSAYGIVDVAAAQPMRMLIPKKAAAAGAGSDSITVVIAGTNDDGGSYHTGATFFEDVTENQNQVRFESPTDFYMAGVLFVATVPQGSTIDSCHLNVFVTSGNWDDETADTVLIKMYDVDDAAQFTSVHNTHDMLGHEAVTSAYIQWEPGASSAVPDYYRTVNLASLLQVVVDRAGYTSASRVGIILYPNSAWVATKYFFVEDVSAVASNNAFLEIGWH